MYLPLHWLIQLLVYVASKAAKVPAAKGNAAASTSQLKAKTPTPSVAKPDVQVSQLQQDIAGIGLEVPDDVDFQQAASSLPPVATVDKSKLMAQIKAAESASEYKPQISLVVVGHVDAGKSTLMGRLLADLGEMAAKTLRDNQRQSEKVGKSSFAYAWAFDATAEERSR